MAKRHLLHFSRSTPNHQVLWDQDCGIQPHHSFQRKEVCLAFPYFFAALITFLLKVGWVWNRYWKAYVCILCFFLPVPSVRRLDYSCRQLQSRLPWPKVRISAPVPCCLPWIYTQHRAHYPSAASPEIPTCYPRGMLKPFLLTFAHPLAPTPLPVLCPPCMRSIWLSLKAVGKGGEGKSTSCQLDFLK